MPILLFRELRFSPDGRFLAFEIDVEVFILDVTDGTYRQLTHTNHNARSPDWSPDGSRIVYTRPLAPGGIFIIDVTTGEEKQLFFNGQHLVGGKARWSPKGEPIAFWSGEGSETLDIFSVHSDGTDFRRLTASGSDAFAQYPRWLYGGTHLLYTWRLTRDAASSETHIMLANGDEQHRWPLHLYDSEAISPDSRDVVLYGLQPGSGDSLAVLFIRGLDDVAGTSLRQLTSYQPPPPHWQIVTTIRPHENTEVPPWLAAWPHLRSPSASASPRASPSRRAR